jgi:hypothetical protein
MTAAYVFVDDLSDVAVIRVYARESAAQRGNTGTAMAESRSSFWQRPGGDLLISGERQCAGNTRN